MLLRDGETARASSTWRGSSSHIPRQPHGELVISDGHQHARAFDVRYPRDRVSESGRITEARCGEDRPRTAVQHDPVASVLCDKKVPPALLAQIDLRLH
jgi:hypothetical protein